MNKISISLSRKKASTLGVLVGTNCVDKGGKRYEVEEYIAHEKYKHVPNTFDSHGSDIALIRVKGEIEFNDRVQSIPLSSEEFSDGVEALLTGWGRVEVSKLCLQIAFLNYIMMF